MKQRETKVCIYGFPQTVRYRTVSTSQGIIYEGLVGNVAFSFSQTSDPFHYSSLLDDIDVRKPLVAAVLDYEADHLAENGL